MKLSLAGGAIAVLLLIAAIVGYSALFTVYQTQQALVVRLGKVVRVVNESDSAELEMLQSRFNSLSFRQRQVMELAVAGLSSKEIATQLKISSKTVENHRAWVMERVGARNLAELVRMAMQIQLRS